MLKSLSKCFRFSQFYQPCNFKIDSENLLSSTCPLSFYVNLYRKYGHYYAKLDPLNIYNKNYQEFCRPTDVGISFHTNLAQYQFNRSPVVRASKSVEQLQKKLMQTYLNTTGVEFSHVGNLQEEEWLYENYEKFMLEQLPNEVRTHTAKQLIKAQAFDHFLHKKFVTFKRYSGEGAQSTVIALDQLFKMGAENDFEHIVFGMPHRGKLNTLANVLEYPPSQLFHKISGKTDTPHELHNVIDDVTSHIGQSIYKNYDGKKTKVTLVHNPSHLEAQNAVSMGKARSKQAHYGQQKVLNIQVHGDAALCAQGIAYQSLLLGKVPKFDIDGTIHLITNNQLGYTTRPIDSRGSKYSSDIAKAFNIPIIHVNSENIEDVYRSMKLCMEYRLKFKKDILVDLICYRKYGHNEVDEPEFTQPKMYHQIRKVHIPNTKTYSQQLIKEGLLRQNVYDEVRKQYFEQLQHQFVKMKEMKHVNLKQYMDPNRKGPKAFTQQWSQFKPSQYGEEQATGFDIQTLRQFTEASAFYPSDFNIHARIKKYHIDERLKSIQKNSLNWATCENLALFTLNYEGFNIRMSGQDVERGTFSQRHMNLIDQKTQQSFNSLEFFSNNNPGRGKVEIFNSPLTQNAAMSYEYGYSLDNPLNMVIWEAQFGDFYNTAQVLIDTHLVNSQNKWLRQCALTLLLPHGFDGAGPQHSSCRIQRFLQLANSNGGIIYNKRKEKCDGHIIKMREEQFVDNIQEANFSLAYPTKPANMFHLLRRQMKRNFRKPLVIAGPKGLLRNSKCLSSYEDMGPHSQFKEIIGYKNHENIQNCQAIILCSGKFVYDILGQLQNKKSEKTALFSIQELFPFPEAQIQEILSKISKNASIYWVQEENINGGAFYFAQRRIARAMRNVGINSDLRYVGRRAISGSAVGSVELHKKQVQELTEWINDIIV